MATSTLDTELTCSICLEFYRDPYQLPCMHSFCKPCLLKLSKPNGAANTQRNKTENLIQCPECRQIVRLNQNGVDGLPKNFTLANIVKKYTDTDEKQSKCFQCDVCDAQPPRDAAKRCLQCGLLYCKSCLTQVHPNRGKFKNHQLMEPSKNRGLETLSPSLETLSPSDVKMIDSLNSSTTILDIQQRTVERQIKEIQKNMDLIQDDGERRKSETLRAFDKLRTLLKTKEEDVIEEIENEVDSKTDSLLFQLGAAVFFSEDLKRTLKDAKIAVEEFPRKITRSDIQAIERRISDLKDKRVYTFPEKLDPACGVVNLEHIEKKLETLGNIENGKIKTGHIWNISIQNIPKRNGASVSVSWDKVPRKDVYDVTVHCSQNGVVERTSVCGVEGSSYRVDNLRPDTCYRLTVAVHQDGESKTESKLVKFKTLKCVPCAPFRLNGKMASEDTFISDGSRIMMPATAPQTCSWQKYSRISGTTGTLQVASGTQYWETKLEFSVPKSVFKGCCIFDVGICSKTAVDKITAFHKNYNSYSISIVKRENKFVRVECNYEGHDVVGEGENLVWDSQFKLHFGYYLDIKARTFSVINVTKNSILWTFNNIKSNVYYVPVFTHCNGQFKSQQPELLLITGEDITAIPSCIASLLDDHCILESSDNEESIVSIYEDEEDGFCFFPF